MNEAKKKKVKDLFQKYFLKNHLDDIKDILRKENDSSSYSIHVDCTELFIYAFEEIANFFFYDTPPYIELLNYGLKEAQRFVYDSDPEKNEMAIKSKVSARLHSLPQENGIKIKTPSSENRNRLVSMDGTIVKASVTRMLESSQEYICKKCGAEFSVSIDFGKDDLMVKPTRCVKNTCNSDKFQHVTTTENFKSQVKDYQEIKIQEKIDRISKGCLPQSCLVILEDDLVDIVKPGDDVTINGIIVDRWDVFRDDLRPDIDLIIQANSIDIHNQNDRCIHITKAEEKIFSDFWQEHKTRPLTGRNIILSSLCPQLYGMYIVKLAVALVIAGGVSRKDATGTRVRGESHLLLAGDPGTGKSQFLKYANKIVPRSVLTTGIGSTSAGLTATASRVFYVFKLVESESLFRKETRCFVAFKEGGLWHLEAGALVLADGGICCVDEFNCMKEQDRSSMLEAMEQQTISVAKAGIVCKLKTQCSILAACNPKGTYDSNQPITVNIAISSPLLSRFDIVLLLMDAPNKDWDTLASTYLLTGKDLLIKEKNICPWKFNQLRLYMNYIKNIVPMLTPDANLVIQKYYQLQRQSDDRNAARTTVRMLESVIRLSQAHAKLMCRDQVLVMDAVVAITLMECSLNKTASFCNVNILHTSFPDQAEVEYESQVQLILNKLNLTDLLNQELENIHRNMEPFCSDTSINESENENNPCATQFGVITQLIGAVPTQKPAFTNRILNSTVKENAPPGCAGLSPNNVSEIKDKNFESNKKRGIEQILHSPSAQQTNESKKSKLCSQTMRALSRFEFHADANKTSPDKRDSPVITQKSDKANEMRTQTVKTTQKAKLTQTQKDLMLNFDNDDLDFDI